MGIKRLLSDPSEPSYVFGGKRRRKKSCGDNTIDGTSKNQTKMGSGGVFNKFIRLYTKYTITGEHTVVIRNQAWLQQHYIGVAR